jgi:hypothetical protein
MSYIKYVWLFVLVQLLFGGLELRYGLKFADMDSFNYWAGTGCIFMFVSGFAWLLEPKK